MKTEKSVKDIMKREREKERRWATQAQVKPDGKDSNHSAEGVKRVFNTQRASAGCSANTSRSGFVTESQRETE